MLLCSLQLVMGGRYYSISPDEYIFAALNIYLVSSTGQRLLCRAEAPGGAPPVAVACVLLGCRKVASPVAGGSRDADFWRHTGALSLTSERVILCVLRRPTDMCVCPAAHHSHATRRTSSTCSSGCCPSSASQAATTDDCCSARAASTCYEGTDVAVAVVLQRTGATLTVGDWALMWVVTVILAVCLGEALCIVCCCLPCSGLRSVDGGCFSRT